MLSAAHLLCESGDLADPSTWIEAVAAYNGPVDYTNEVAAAADQYREQAEGGAG